MSEKMIYGINDKPKFSKLLLFAFQQVLAVLAATIAVPSIIGLSVNIPSAIFGAGVGTLTYLFFTKFKSPVIISSSFAFLGALANALVFGYMGITLGAVFAGLVYVIIALIIHFTGTGWVDKLMPPVIIGPTVALIGLSLSVNAVGDLTTATAAGQSYNWVAIFCGLVTFFTVVIISVLNSKKFNSIRCIPFIIGIGAGYLVASIFTAIGNAADVEYLKIINWKPLVDNFKNIKDVTPFISVPKFSLVEGIKELANGKVSAEVLAANPAAKPLTWIGVAEVALAFIPVAFVTFAEHIADHKNLSTIIDQDLVNGEPGLKRTLLGDGVGSIVGTMFGICPNTTYGESVGCVAISRNASVRTTIAASGILLLLSFLTPINKVLMTIPNCVMGGVCLCLYGFIAVSGLRMFKHVDLDDNKNLFVVSIILVTGIGGLSLQIPYDNKGGVITITSIATALILGIITNLAIKSAKKLDDYEEPEKEGE